MRVKVLLVLAKVATPPWNVLITAIPSSCKMSLNSEAASPTLSRKRSPVTPGFRRHPKGRPSDR